MANERASAVRFVSEVLATCRNEGVREVTFFAVLDNASTDGTQGLLREFAAQEPGLCVVWAPENKSVVDAYVRGYREALDAGSDWILEIDAGYSHQPKEIPQFFERMSANTSCVFGSRFCADGRMSTSVNRHFISRGGTVLANMLLGTRLTDMTSGFELFSRDALSAVLAKGIRSRGHFFQTEIRAYCRDMNTAEVPIHYQNPGDPVTMAVLGDAFRNLLRLTRNRIFGTLAIT